VFLIDQIEMSPIKQSPFALPGSLVVQVIVIVKPRWCSRRKLLIPAFASCLTTRSSEVFSSTNLRMILGSLVASCSPASTASANALTHLPICSNCLLDILPIIYHLLLTSHYQRHQIYYHKYVNNQLIYPKSSWH